MILKKYNNFIYYQSNFNAPLRTKSLTMSSLRFQSFIESSFQWESKVLSSTLQSE